MIGFGVWKTGLSLCDGKAVLICGKVPLLGRTW